MLINVKSLSTLSQEAVSRTYIEAERPTVVADLNFKLVAKTRSVNQFLPSVRRGTKLTRFLSEKAVFDIKNMESESVYHTDILTKNSDISAVIIRKDENYLMIFDRFFGEILGNTVEVYGKMSGYDNKLCDESDPLSIRRNKIKELLGDALDTFKVIRGLPFFESVSVIRYIAAKLSKTEFGRKIEFSFPDEKVLTSGNEKDFAEILMLLISFLSEDSPDISVGLEVGDDVISLSVIGNSGFLPFERIDLKRYLCSPEKKDDNSILLYIVKLLSDANLWDVNPIFENGISGFRLILPYIKSGDEFLLREHDFDYIDGLIEAFFK